MMAVSAGSTGLSNLLSSQAMFNIRSLLLLVFLTGCAGPDAGSWAAWPWPFAFQGKNGQGAVNSPRGPGYASFRFDWQLAGDPEIMPVQVFDDGSRMWLQFSPEGAWPAVFEVSALGLKPLVYRRDGPYMVVDGVHDLLELRGGSLQGTIRRSDRQASEQADASQFPSVGTEHALLGQDLVTAMPVLAGPERAAGAVTEPEPATEVPVAADNIPGLGAPAGDPITGVSLSMPGTVQPVQLASEPAVPLSWFSVSPADITMRQALERWAGASGWTFSPEHWAVDVDIPLVGEAHFETDFRTAVRELLAATEMGDRPLQPCFYSNRVVRVVPYAQPCDRRAGMGVMS